MPDQYGRVTGRDWLGLTGAISNIDSMRRGQEYLAGEKREATEFEQSQEDRAKKKGGEDVYGNVFSETIQGYVNRGLADPAGKTFTREGLETLVDTPGDRSQAMKGLEQYGEYAQEAAQAMADANKLLLGNEEAKDGLNKILLDRSDKNFKDVSSLIKSGGMHLERGDKAGSAIDLAKAMERSGYRLHAKPTKDNNIEVWRTVMGKRQTPKLYTPQEALIEAKKLSRERFVVQTASEKGAGIESNFNPKTTAVIDPQGNTHYYRQNFKLDGSVEYLTFGSDNKPTPNDPPTLEQAYDKGWMNEKDVLERERAAEDLKLVTARREKIQKETGEIGKPKAGEAEKPMTADEARKRIVELAKFESSLNKTGGWNETLFELMAKKNPDFAKSALTITSSKKKVRETIKKLRKRYESLIPEFEEGPKSFGSSDAPEETTATNPKTGEKIITKNGEWILSE